jgi:hypothetical protein
MLAMIIFEFCGLPVRFRFMVLIVWFAPMKFASLILPIFHGINLDRLVRYDRLDRWHDNAASSFFSPLFSSLPSVICAL